MKIAKTVLSLMIALAAIFSLSQANAALISEIEPNNSIATAQNIDSYFTTEYNTDIFNSTTNPWVSISGTGNGTYDYYSFTSLAGSSFVFDIDYGKYQGGSIDTEIFLFDASGNYLVGNDDGGVYDSGTTHPWDALLEYTFTNAGTYIIGVGEFDSEGIYGGISGNAADYGDTYTLQVSRDFHITTPTPEPSTYLLLGIGLFGFFTMRKKIGNTNRK